MNGVDPSGLMNVMSCISVATIGLGAASIGIPTAGIAYLSITGQVSGYNVIAKLLSIETWREALVAFAIGTGSSVIMQKILISAGKSIATKVTPVTGLLFGITGLLESIKTTYKMLTNKLPANDAEQYIATMLATNIISGVFLGGVRLMPKKGIQNDDVYLNLSNKEKKLYNKGQIMVSNETYKEIIANGLDGNHVQDIIKRGEFLKNANQLKLALSRLSGFWQAGIKSITGQGDGITLGQWFGTGLTPEGRFALVENAPSVYTSILGVFGIMSEIKYNLDDWSE
jgi:hypothetical protein